MNEMLLLTRPRVHCCCSRCHGGPAMAAVGWNCSRSRGSSSSGPRAWLVAWQVASEWLRRDCYQVVATLRVWGLTCQEEGAHTRHDGSYKGSRVLPLSWAAVVLLLRGALCSGVRGGVVCGVELNWCCAWRLLSGGQLVHHPTWDWPVINNGGDLLVVSVEAAEALTILWISLFTARPNCVIIEQPGGPSCGGFRQAASSSATAAANVTRSFIAIPFLVLCAGQAAAVPLTEQCPVPSFRQPFWGHSGAQELQLPPALLLTGCLCRRDTALSCNAGRQF